MTLYGPDGSSWQKGIKLTQADWDAIDFVIWRCASEGGQLDATFGWARDQAKAHNKPFMAYTFLPSDPSGADEATVAVIGDRSIPVMADWERTGCTFDEMLTWVHAMRGKGYKVPFLYTGKGFWQANGSPTLSGYGLELVVARYGGQKADAEYEIVPRYEAMNQLYGAETWGWNLGGLRPVLWQYSSRVRWGDRFMDMNAFRGTRHDLTKWFKVWGADQPAPPVGVPARPARPATPVWANKPTSAINQEAPPVRPIYIVSCEPDGQYFATDLFEVANKITPNVAAGGRDFHGWVAQPDSGPFPMDAEWSDYIRAIAR